MQKKDILIFTSILYLLLGTTVSLVLIIVTLPFVANGHLKLENLIPKSDWEIAQETDFFTKDYNVSLLVENEQNKKIKYGYELITNTHKYIGPHNGDSKKIYTGNELSCKNCHLGSGTKAFSAPYIGVTKKFPEFRNREGKIGTIEDRINGCMQRSMNGKKLPNGSDEMKAIVAYMEWLSTGVPKDFKPNGQGFIKINIPNRKVDLAHGNNVYQTSCIACHGDNGQGVKNRGTGYIYPPLWGNDTYNHGAGMHRVLTAAQFIKGNMPLGATANNPILTDEEAYDVAGYINSFKRPMKRNPKIDFPDKKLKPVSTPYGPYADSFSSEQHQYGPFQEIIDYYKKEFDIKKTK